MAVDNIWSLWVSFASSLSPKPLPTTLSLNARLKDQDLASRVIEL